MSNPSTSKLVKKAKKLKAKNPTATTGQIFGALADDAAADNDPVARRLSASHRPPTRSPSCASAPACDDHTTPAPLRCRPPCPHRSAGGGPGDGSPGGRAPERCRRRSD